MPTLFYKFGFRFYFVSFDCNEPVHIHVGNDVKKVCKFWLRKGEVLLSDTRGFSKKELLKIESVIKQNYKLLETKFNEHCKDFKKQK